MEGDLPPADRGASNWEVYQPFITVGSVINEDSTPRGRVHLASRLAGYMHECGAAKHSQVLQVWSLSSYSLHGDDALAARSSVENANGSGHCELPVS